MRKTYTDAFARNAILGNTVLGFAALLAISGACGGEDTGDDNALPTCDEDTRDEAYVAGISKTGEAGYTVAIVDSLPAPPAKGDNDWSLEVRDSSDAPAAGLILESEQYMPDHGHTSPVIATLSDDGDGAYTLTPINLFMPGYWETTITVIDPGATDAEDDDVELDSVVFKFCVEG